MISYSPPPSNKLRDDSGVLALDGNARQALASDGSVGADWSSPEILTTAPDIRTRVGPLYGDYRIGIGSTGYPAIVGAGDTIVISPKIGAAFTQNALALGTFVWAANTYAMALGSGYAGGEFSSVIGGDGGATHPVTIASCVDTILTAIGDVIWGSAAAFNSHIRIGDYVLLQDVSDLKSWDTVSITDVSASTITVASAPTNGDGTYNVFVLHAGSYGQQIYSNPPFDCGGDAQRSKWLASNVTTDATATRLILGNKDTPGGPDDRNQIRIFKGQAKFFTIKVLGLKDNITAFGGIYKGLISNPSGTTALIGSVTSEEWKDASAAAWSVVVTADSADPIGELAITVTGASASNIRWMGFVDSTEVAWFPAAA